MGDLLLAVALGAATGGLGYYFAGASFLTGALVGAGFAALNYLLLDQPSGGSLLSPQKVRLTIRDPNPYRNYILGRRRVGGVEIYHSTRPDSSGGEDNEGYLDWVQVLADHPCESIERIYINGEQVLFDSDGDIIASSLITNSPSDLPAHIGGKTPRNYTPDQQRETQARYAGNAHIEFRLDGSTAPFPSLDQYGEWNSASDKGTGLALMYFRGLFDREVYPNGEPDIELEMKGANTVYDPRSDTTGWTDNAALLIAWYLKNFPNINVRQINEAVLIKAANICDEDASVTLNDGTSPSAKRYRIDAYVRFDEAVQKVLKEMEKTIGGAIFYTHGEGSPGGMTYADTSGWHIIPGASITATLSLDPSELANIVSIQPKIPSEERSNVIYPHYIDRAKDWELASMPVVSNPNWVLEDKEEVVEQVDFLYVTSLVQATRLTYQYMAQKRLERQIIVQVADFEKGMRLHVGRTVTLDYPLLGLEDALFYITNWQPVPADEGVVFELTLKEYSPDIYVVQDIQNFNPSVINESSLVTSQYVPLMRGLAAESGEDQLQVLNDGTVLSRIEVTWTRSNSAYSDHVEIRWRKVSEPESAEKTITSSGDSVYLNNVEDLVEYVITARHVNVLGVRGVASSITHTLIGKSLAPDGPTHLYLAQRGSVVSGTISAPTNRDVVGILIRYERIDVSADPADLPEIISQDDWDEATEFGTLYVAASSPSASETFTLPLDHSGRYRIAIRFVDSSGNESELISAIALFVRLDTHEVTLGYSPAWVGAKTNYVVVNGELLPDGARLASEVTAKQWAETHSGPQRSGGVDRTLTFAPDEIELPNQIQARIIRTHRAEQLPIASTVWDGSATNFPLLDEPIAEASIGQFAYNYSTKQAVDESTYTATDDVAEVVEINLIIFQPTHEQVITSSDKRGYKLRTMNFNLDKVV